MYSILEGLQIVVAKNYFSANDYKSSTLSLCEDLRSHPLLVVGDDAADEVGVGVPQRGHELGQLLLVQLTHGPEHPLLGLIGGTERRLVHPRNLVQTHDPVHWREGKQRGDDLNRSVQV